MFCTTTSVSLALSAARRSPRRDWHGQNVPFHLFDRQVDRKFGRLRAGDGSCDLGHARLVRLDVLDQAMYQLAMSQGRLSDHARYVATGPLLLPFSTGEDELYLRFLNGHMQHPHATHPLKRRRASLPVLPVHHILRCATPLPA